MGAKRYGLYRKGYRIKIGQRKEIINETALHICLTPFPLQRINWKKQQFRISTIMP